MAQNGKNCNWPQGALKSVQHMTSDPSVHTTSLQKKTLNREKEEETSERVTEEGCQADRQTMS